MTIWVLCKALHPPFATGGNDLVLAKGKCRNIAHGPDLTTLISRAIGLPTVPLFPQQPFPDRHYGDPPARRCRETFFFIIR